MRDDICTIPVSEVFEENTDECPICRMYKKVEERITAYIMGDAMMEPDVRIQTNKRGFCPKHIDLMLSRRGRLQLALMLETHIKSISEEIFSKKLFFGADKKSEKMADITKCCFICDKTEWGISRMIETIYRCYESEADFRNLFNSQSNFCAVHYTRLVGGANKRKMPRYYNEFCNNITRITSDYLLSLYSDISEYCKLYDYRNASSATKADENVKNSVERTANFLKGEID